MRHNIEYCEVQDGIQYCTITREHAQQAVDFMFDVFFKDEPVSNKFGGYTTRPLSIVKQLEDVIDDGTSIMALDLQRNNKMVGVRLAYSITREQVPPRGTFESFRKEFPDTHAAILAILDELTYAGGIFQSHSDVTKIYDMYALAILSDYRGQGIAGKLVSHALKVATKADCNAVAVLATSDYSSRIFKKMGMEVIGVKRWRDVDFKGMDYFQQVPSEHAIGYFMKL